MFGCSCAPGRSWADKCQKIVRPVCPGPPRQRRHLGWQCCYRLTAAAADSVPVVVVQFGACEGAGGACACCAGPGPPPKTPAGA